jgi:hypothetical protein
VFLRNVGGGRLIPEYSDVHSYSLGNFETCLAFRVVDNRVLGRTLDLRGRKCQDRDGENFALRSFRNLYSPINVITVIKSRDEMVRTCSTHDGWELHPELI